jgi:hypothetical protein
MPGAKANLELVASNTQIADSKTEPKGQGMNRQHYFCKTTMEKAKSGPISKEGKQETGETSYHHHHLPSHGTFEWLLGDPIWQWQLDSVYSLISLLVTASLFSRLQYQLTDWLKVQGKLSSRIARMPPCLLLKKGSMWGPSPKQKGCLVIFVGAPTQNDCRCCASRAASYK